MEKDWKMPKDTIIQANLQNFRVQIICCKTVQKFSSRYCPINY